MAWHTKSGQTSNQEHDATRHGTGPQQGIHVRKSTEEQLKEGAELHERWARIRSGHLEF
jgi:hypothetical protein